MGDRIAILKEGGILAQYATPAELLMYPADAVRGGLRRLRPGAQAARAAARARHRPLEGAARADRRAGLRGASAKLADADLDIPLVVDDDGPADGLAVRARPPGRAGARGLPLPAEPIVELDDILRDALSDLLSADSQYGPVVDARRPRRRRALDRGALARAHACPPSTCRARRSWPSRGLIVPDLAAYVPVLAQLGDDFFGNREGAAEKCPGNNGLCPGWIADNFSDYIDPFWEHVLLSIVPLAIGFVIATSLALLRPSLPRGAALLPGLRRGAVHDPLDRLLPDPAQHHGPRVRDRRGRADGLHAGADLPQRR